MAEVAGEGVGSGDGVGACLDLDGAVAAAVLTNLRIDQPVCCSGHLLTASAAKTMVRCASIEFLVR